MCSTRPAKQTYSTCPCTCHTAFMPDDDICLYNITCCPIIFQIERRVDKYLAEARKRGLAVSRESVETFGAKAKAELLEFSILSDEARDV